MKINVSHTEKIEKQFEEVQKNCYVRKIDCPAETVQSTVRQVEEKLEAMHIPKKAWKGITATRYPEAVPASYKYLAMGTGFRIERFSSGWFLTVVRRFACDARPYGDRKWDISIHLTEQARNEIPFDIQI